MVAPSSMAASSSGRRQAGVRTHCRPGRTAPFHSNVVACYSFAHRLTVAQAFASSGVVGATRPLNMQITGGARCRQCALRGPPRKSRRSSPRGLPPAPVTAPSTNSIEIERRVDDESRASGSVLAPASTSACCNATTTTGRQELMCHEARVTRDASRASGWRRKTVGGILRARQARRRCVRTCSSGTCCDDTRAGVGVPQPLKVS